MARRDQVELQGEVNARRDVVFPLMATADGLGQWLDEAELEPRPGAPVRFRLRDAVAVGKVLAVDAPQHISFSWDWLDEPLGVPSVVALDAIDHGRRTHVTLRQVGFPGERQRELHEALWRHWFDRFLVAARRAAAAAGSERQASRDVSPAAPQR